jgi:hypothetical protein
MDKRPGVTNTNRREWKKHCADFKRAGVPFKVVGVKTDDQVKFLLNFAAKHNLAVAHGDRVLYFSPRSS